MNLINEYRLTLKQIETEEFSDLILYRPLAFGLVKIMIPLPVTPNQLTMISMILGVFAGILYGFGLYATTIAAAILFLAANVFDCADGQLARIKRNGTKTGRIIDGLADYITGIATTLGIAIGYSTAYMEPHFWWILVFASSVSMVIHSVVLDYYRNEFVSITTGKVQTALDEYLEFKEEYERLQKENGSRIEMAIIWIYLKYTKFQMSRIPQTHGSDDLVTPESYFRKNRLIIRLWTLIGSSSHITIAIICSFFNRLDIFLWIVLLVQNSLMVILLFWQKVIIDRTK